MARRKHTSLRRWKARCALGRMIPATAILQHRLDRWFVFAPVMLNMDAYFAEPRHG